MKRKNSFFLIGMTSVLLAFAMIGCDTGTSNGGSNTPTYPYTPTQPGPQSVDGDLFANDEAGLAAYLNGTLAGGSLPESGPIYVVSDVEVRGDLIVPEGKSIVITDDPVLVEKARSAGIGIAPNAGVLFARYDVITNAKLTVKSGGSLKVESEGSVVLGSTTNATLGGVLVIEGGGALTVEGGATLAVTTASQVELKTTTSRLDIGGTLNIVGTLTEAETVLGAEPEGEETYVPLITVTEGSAAIIIDNATIQNNGAEAPTLAEEVNTEAEGSTTVKSTGTAGDVSGLLVEDAIVTYTGEDALSAIEIPANATLIITGTIASQTAIISGAGTLEVKGELTTSAAHTVTTVKNSGTIVLSTDGSFSGTVDNTGGTISTADATALAAILVKVTAGTVSVTGSEDVTTASDITVADGVTLDLALTDSKSLIVDADKTLTLNGAISGAGGLKTAYNADGAAANNGVIKTAKAATLLATLDKVSEGNVEVSANLEIADATVKGTAVLKIAANTTLTVTGTLAVSNAITGDTSATIVVGTSGQLTAPTNFYYSNGTTTLGHPITEGTYTWGDSKWTGTATDPATSKDAATPAQVTWPDNIETVNYEGTTALGTINIPDGKTLVIKAAVADGSNAITLEGSTSTLEIASPNGSIDLGTGGSITNNGGTITNNGTIKTAATSTGGETVLRALVGFGGTGKVSWNGTSTASVAVTLTESPLTLNTQDLEIGEFATLNLATYTISNYSKVTNGGTITTGAATLTALTPILAVHGNITATAIEVGTSGNPDTSAVLTVPADTDLTITGLTVTEATSVLTIVLTEAGAGGTVGTLTTGTITNAGTIKTSNSTVLETLLSKVTTGMIEVTGTDASLAGGTVQGTATLKVSGTLTVNGAITATGTITNEGIIVLGSSGSITDYGQVTNNGTIKTSQVDKLEALLASGGITAGIVEASGTLPLTDDATVPGGVTLTLAENTTLTVPDTKTLTLGASGEDGAATLTLTNDTSKLVLQAGGILNAANNDSTITAATVGVTDDEENEYAVLSGSTITADSGTSGTGTLNLGKLILTITSGVIEPSQNSSSGTAGSLTAGEETEITFAGA